MLKGLLTMDGIELIGLVVVGCLGLVGLLKLVSRGRE